MPPHRDVAAFDERAPGYESGWLGRLHHQIADRVADLALETCERPRRMLDVGCGTGYLLRRLAPSCPDAVELVGVDPSSPMIEAARRAVDDDRLCFTVGVAERLAYDDDVFDLAVSTTSFDHWTDQQQGLRQCARVLVTGGTLVVADQFSRWLAPTLVLGRRGKARTVGRATRLLWAAGLHSPVWHEVYTKLIKAVTATA
jgi:ubiquinone/menaquinone biosynthesis C-methylase UbiE